MYDERKGKTSTSGHVTAGLLQAVDISQICRWVNYEEERH